VKVAMQNQGVTPPFWGRRSMFWGRPYVFWGRRSMFWGRPYRPWISYPRAVGVLVFGGNMSCFTSVLGLPLHQRCGCDTG
jgi:hypothetical protein